MNLKKQSSLLFWLYKLCIKYNLSIYLFFFIENFINSSEYKAVFKYVFELITVTFNSESTIYCYSLITHYFYYTYY